MGYGPLAQFKGPSLFWARINPGQILVQVDDESTCTEVQISFQFNWVFTPLDFHELLFFQKQLLKNIIYPLRFLKLLIYTIAGHLGPLQSRPLTNSALSKLGS